MTLLTNGNTLPGVQNGKHSISKITPIMRVLHFMLAAPVNIFQVSSNTSQHHKNYALLAVIVIFFFTKIPM